MSKSEIYLNDIKVTIKPILKKAGVKKAGIFGSYARGEQKKKSDVDILIQISDKYSLLDLIKLRMAIKEKLKKKVDLIEYSTIHPLIKEQVLKEEVRII